MKNAFPNPARERSSAPCLGTLRSGKSPRSLTHSQQVNVPSSYALQSELRYNNLITLNGYELNLFDVGKQERIKRIKSKYNSNALIENVCLSYESCLHNDDSKTSSVTVDQNNLLNLWISASSFIFLNSLIV